MSDSKNRKGFSGFDDLVSDIGMDIEGTKAVGETQPFEVQPTKHPHSKTASATHSSSPPQQEASPISAQSEAGINTNIEVQRNLDEISSVRKIVIGTFMAIILIVFILNLHEVPPDKPSSPQQTHLQAKTSINIPKEKIETIAPEAAPSPVLPQTISTFKETKPSKGINNILGRDEIRYCLSESIRIGAMREEVDPYVEAQVNHFNATVQDYNSRCSRYRCRRELRESVHREVESQRSHLEAEGASRIKY